MTYVVRSTGWLRRRACDPFGDVARHVEGAGGLPEFIDEQEGGIDLNAEEIHKARVQLYFWHKGWAKVAHTVITRRDWLIQLGLARQRRPSDSE